jgi:large subunit ribosomal protein L11
MIDKALVKHIKKIYIMSQSADPSPPLGTVLGNLGVNTNTFCTSFNSFTKNLPNYFSLKVIIYVLENRTTSFAVSLSSIGYILTLLKFAKSIKVRVFDRVHDKIFFCVTVFSLLKLAKFKFPHSSLKKSFPVVLGSVKSMNLRLVY